MNYLQHSKLSIWATLILFLLPFSSAMADSKAKISFEKTRYDFGSINEKDGDVTCEFKFTNNGEAPLLILRAQASCGCTYPEYPKEPIRPGKSGVISVTYHAKGRPGPFQKSIYVYDNSSPNHRTTLLIAGNVISNKTPEESYSKIIGPGLRIKSNTLAFFDMYPNRPNHTRSLGVYNEGNTPITLTFANVPKHIFVESDPQIIEPKKEGKIMVTYYTSRVKDWGKQKDYFNILIKGKETQMTNNQIAVTADIWEDFSSISKKEKDKAPVIDVDVKNLNFGKAENGKTLRIKIANTGKDKLLIRKIQNDQPEIFSCKLKDESVKGGNETYLDVTFNPAKCRLETMNHHITIITNDPDNSRVIVNMTANK